MNPTIYRVQSNQKWHTTDNNDTDIDSGISTVQVIIIFAKI